MKIIKILDAACADCRATIALIEAVAREKGVVIVLQKVNDQAEIAQAGLAAPPGVVIDDELVHAGGVPARSTVEGWFEEPPYIPR